MAMMVYLMMMLVQLRMMIFSKKVIMMNMVMGLKIIMSGGEGSDDSDQEFEDYSGSYSDGGSDDDGYGDEDDDDDDIDTEDYDDDDEEETDEEDEGNREDDKSSSEDSTEKNNQYPRLKNAKDVYTSEVTFLLFEHERKKTRTLDIDVKRDMNLSDRGLEITYEVRRSWQFERCYTVTALPMDGIVECSCKYFELSGVLCSHLQVALKCLRIDKIPDCYRLQKDKNMPPGPAEGVHSLIKNQEKCRQSSPHCTEFNGLASLPNENFLFFLNYIYGYLFNTACFLLHFFLMY
ncbi:uncharacterized protein LOC141689343 [Apium graveolens]|uniref:uncharacterized protein LOC141689343 n=1 Tax=Apium graveolens TaxID=4045 RepID=UPI003D7AB9BD